MGIIKRPWNNLFGPKPDDAWVIVEFNKATVRLWGQESIDWFFSSGILDGVVVEKLTVRRGNVGIPCGSLDAKIAP